MNSTTKPSQNTRKAASSAAEARPERSQKVLCAARLIIQGNSEVASIA
jgi:hypothetical protein